MIELNELVETYLFSAFQEIKSQRLTDTVLSLHEIALIYHYSDSGYENINNTLKKNKGIATNNHIRFLCDTLNKLPDYQGVVFRGVNFDKFQKQRYIDAFNQNKPIQEFCFISTSRSELIANSFSKGDTMCMIFSKTGKQIENFSKFGLHSGQNEKEVLFLPNTIFEVLEILQDTTKTTIILEEII